MANGSLVLKARTDRKFTSTKSWEVERIEALTGTSKECDGQRVQKIESRTCDLDCIIDPKDLSLLINDDQRKKQTVNAATSPAEWRKQHEVFELASRMAERLYSMPPFQRLGYIEEIVQLARSGGCPRVRQILTMPKLIYPNPQEKHLFLRGDRSYCTISQAADRYCRISPWNAEVAEVVRGEVPEPPTGEITKEVAAAA